MGEFPHQFTEEERRRGREQRWAEYRARRDEALDRIQELTPKALDRLEQQLADEEGHVAARAVREVLDRVLGRPRQAHEHTGPAGGPLRAEVKLDVDHLARVASILARAG